MKHSLYKLTIKLNSLICRNFIQTTNDSVIMNQLINDVTRKDTFGTISYINFIFQFRT